MINIKFKNLERQQQRFAQAPRVLSDMVEKNFRALGRVLSAKMRREMEPMRYTGETQNSVSSELAITGTRWQLKVGPTGKIASIMRTGSRPHWAPIEPLKRWAQWKLGDAGAAYAVQRNIAKYGTSRYLAKRGVPGAEQTRYGIGLDYPGQTLKRGDVQQGITRTTKRVGFDLKVWIEDGVRSSVVEAGDAS